MGNREKHARKRSGADSSNSLGALKNSFIGVGIALGVALLLLVLAALTAYMSDDTDKLISPLSYAALYISSISAGFAAVKLNRSGALLCGAISGVLLAIIFFFMSVFFGESYSSGMSFLISLLLRLAMIFFSVLGAFMGLHRKKRRR